MAAGGGRGGGCRVEAGEVLDDATAEDGVLQGAPVEEVVKTIVLKSMRRGTSDLMKTSKKTRLNLRREEHDNGLWQRTTSKTSWKDTQMYVPLWSFVGIMSEVVLTSR